LGLKVIGRCGALSGVGGGVSSRALLQFKIVIYGTRPGEQFSLRCRRPGGGAAVKHPLGNKRKSTN